jgi:hypothetical protein
MGLQESMTGEPYTFQLEGRIQTHTGSSGLRFACSRAAIGNQKFADSDIANISSKRAPANDQGPTLEPVAALRTLGESNSQGWSLSLKK